MVFRETHGRQHRKETPNRLRRMPTYSFRCNLNPEVLAYLKELKKKRSLFINQAIQRNYYLITNRKKFIFEFVSFADYNFKITKHVLRLVGSLKGKYKKKEKRDIKEKEKKHTADAKAH